MFLWTIHDFIETVICSTTYLTYVHGKVVLDNFIVFYSDCSMKLIFTLMQRWRP